MTPNEKKTPCVWVSDSIDPFLDGELSADETRAFDNHIGACSDCREELTLAETVLNGLRGLPPKSCPDRVAGNLYASGLELAADRTAPVRRRLNGWFLRPAVAGALAVIVFTTMFLVGRIDRGTDEVTAVEIARATAEVQLTLAYVGDVSRWTGRTFQQEVIEERVVSPMRRAVHSAIDGYGSPSPTIETNGGSS